jgi:hypothetical protein
MTSGSVIGGTVAGFREYEGGGVIEQTGSVLEFNITGNAGTVSSTINVPSDATIVIVGISGFNGAATYFSGGIMRFTKGGIDTNMILADSTDDAVTAWQATMFYLTLPDTGANKSLKFDWQDFTETDANYKCSVVFFKNVDTASPVRGTGKGRGTTSPPYTTGTITAQLSDLIVAWVAGFAAAEGTINSWSNLTLLSQITDNVHADGAWAIGSPSGNTTVAASTGTNFDDGGIVAISLKKAP